MECGEDEETDSDVDNVYLEERIWDDLEYNENTKLDKQCKDREMNCIKVLWLSISMLYYTQSVYINNHNQ